MTNKQAIFIASTGQNVGKTTVSLGLLAALRKRYASVGFIKPVGQEQKEVDSGEAVDKDALLFRKQFNLTTPWRELSPVLIPPGFTRRYLDGEVTNDQLRKEILSAFHKVSSHHEFTVVEGTGHAGVGAIVEMSNALVARLLGVKVVLVAMGGLGSAFDALALNLSLFREEKVPVAGVILNQVLPEKKQMIDNYFAKALLRWQLPLLGSIPVHPMLRFPCMHDFQTLFNCPWIGGEHHAWHHFRDVRLVAGSLSAYKNERLVNDELIITPASRSDIIEEIVREYREEKEPAQTGVVLTGRHPPSEKSLEALRDADLPSFYTPICSYQAMKAMTSHIAKIGPNDHYKIDAAIDVVGRSLSLDLLLEQLLLTRK